MLSPTCLLCGQLDPYRGPMFDTLMSSTCSLVELEALQVLVSDCTLSLDGHLFPVCGIYYYSLDRSHAQRCIYKCIIFVSTAGITNCHVTVIHFLGRGGDISAKCMHTCTLNCTKSIKASL